MIKFEYFLTFCFYYVCVFMRSVDEYIWSAQSSTDDGDWH